MMSGQAKILSCVYGERGEYTEMLTGMCMHTSSLTWHATITTLTRVLIFYLLHLDCEGISAVSRVPFEEISGLLLISEYDDFRSYFSDKCSIGTDEDMADLRLSQLHATGFSSALKYASFRWIQVCGHAVLWESLNVHTISLRQLSDPIEKLQRLGKYSSTTLWARNLHLDENEGNTSTHSGSFSFSKSDISSVRSSTKLESVRCKYFPPM